MLASVWQYFNTKKRAEIIFDASLRHLANVQHHRHQIDEYMYDKQRERHLSCFYGTADVSLFPFSLKKHDMTRHVHHKSKGFTVIRVS